MWLLAPLSVFAQGLPFHTETALTMAFEERGGRIASRYVPRDSVSTWLAPFVVLPFAPHRRLSTRVVVPLVYRQLTTGASGGATPYREAGLGDIFVAAKWAFFVRDRRGGTTRLAVVGGISLPTGRTGARFDDGPEAPRPLQLGTGAVSGSATLVGTAIRGRWGVSADIGHRRHATADDFRFGPVTRYDVAVGLRFPARVETIRTRTWQIYLEWNGLVSARSRAAGAEIPDSGGHVGFVSPGVQWVPLPQFLLEASLQIPVVEDVNGSQLGYGLRPSLGVRFLFF